jgi:hypothetical protein
MSHPIFALFDPATDKAFETISVTIGGLLAAIWYGKQIFGKKEKSETVFSPQPFIIAMEKEFIKLHTFEEAMKENKREHENIFSKIGGVERGAAGRLEQQLTSMRDESRKDRGELHEKINEARESVAALEATTGLQNQSLAAIQSDVKRILERGRA